MTIPRIPIGLKPFALSGLAIAVLSGACTREPPAPSVSYFRAHPDELVQVMRSCEDDPGGVGRTALCANAAEAARQRDIGSLRDLPPMGLPGAKDAGNARGSDSPAQQREP